MPFSKNIIFITCLCALCAGVFYLYYTYDPAAAAFPFPQCPTKKYLNLYCPGCGAQRAVHQLLHGNILAAVQYNMVLVLLLPLAFVLLLQFIVRHFFNVYWDIPLFRDNRFVYALGIILLLYLIVRNIPLESFDFLRPPDSLPPN